MANNEYLEMLQNGGAPNASANEYSDMLSDSVQQEKSELQQSMFVASQTQPDRAASVQRLAKQTNIPVPVVDRNFDEVSKRAVQENDYLGILKKTPTLGGFLKDHNNSSVAHDDIPALSKIENNVKEYSFLSSMYSALNAGTARLFSSVAKVPALAYDVAVYPHNLIAPYTGQEQARAPEELVNNPVSKYFETQAKSYEVPEMGESVKDHLSNFEFGKAGRAAAIQFASNAPQQAALIVGVLSGYGIPALAAAGVTTAADAVVQNRDTEVDAATATGNALLKGTIESAFERFGTFGILKKWEGAIAQSFGKQAASEVIKDFGKTLLYSMAGEGNEELLTSAAQDLTDYITGVNPDALKGLVGRAVDAGIGGAFSGLVLTGPSAIGAGVGRAQQSRNAALARDFYLSMGESAEATKLRERLPEAQRQYVESLTKNSPVENIYISTEAIETYFQSKDKNVVQEMQAIGVLDKYTEAKETGTDVQIPMSTWVDKVVGTEYYQGFSDDIKFSPQDLSVNEAKSLSEEFKAQAEKSASQEAQTDSADKSASAVGQSISEQLQAAGRTGEEAVVVERGFRALGERLGVDPQELFNQFNLSVQGPNNTNSQIVTPDGLETPEGNNTFNQQSNLIDASSLFGQLKYENNKQKELQRILESKAPLSQYELSALQLRIRDIKNQIDRLPEGSSAADALSNELDPIINRLEQSQGIAKGKEELDRFSSRFTKKSELKAIKDAQDPNAGPYVSTEGIPGIGYAPNYAAKPTGIIGPARISQPNDLENFKETDPLKWSDNKFGATLKLIRDHKNAGIPLTINTSSDLIAADTYIDAMAPDTVINMYLLPGEDGVEFGSRLTRILFPGNPSRQRQDMAVKVLRDAGFQVNAIAPTVQSLIKAIPGGKKKIGKLLGMKGDEVNRALTKMVGFQPKIVTGLTRSNKPNILYQDALPPKSEIETLRERVKELEKELRTNPLTGLRNQKAFIEDENLGWPTVSAIDMDGLKKLNDTIGHEGADNVLRALGAVLLKAENEDVRFYHRSGDEFAGRFRSAEHAQSFMQDVQDRLDSLGVKVTVNGQPYIYDGIGISFGVGENYETADQRANEQKQERLKAGKREDARVSGAPRRLRENAPNQIGGQGDGGGVQSTSAGVGEANKTNWQNLIESKSDGQSKDDVSFLVGEQAVYRGRTGQIQSADSQNILFSDGTASGTMNADTDQFLKEATPASKNVVYEQSDVGNDPRGRIRFGKNGVSIELLKNADRSTFFHELGHFYLDVLGKIASSDKANQLLKDDYQAILKWLGVESADQIGVKEHEQFARGFEAYIMEGKAPSNALREAFSQFRLWLIEVYQTIKNLNVTLTPEVREVMDRLLATEQEIAEIRGDVAPLFVDPSKFGLTGEKGERYQKARDDAERAAKEKLDARVMADFKRKQKAWYREEASVIRAQVESEANQMPVYQALAALQKNETPEGKPFPSSEPVPKLSKEIISKDFGGKERLAKLPRPYVYSSEGGIHPDIAAESYGFASGEALLSALENSVPKDVYVERETAARMTAKYPDILTSPRMSDEALAAVHNDKRSELLRLELEHLASNDLPVLKDVIRKTVKRVPSEKQVRDQADKIIRARKVSDLKPYLFRRAEIRAAKQAADAVAAGDFDAAFQAKRTELLNNELYRSAVEAQLQVDKSLDKFKKIVRTTDEKAAKSRDTDLVNAARSVLAQFGIGRAQGTPASYLENIKRYDPDTYATVSALVDASSQNAAPYENITFDQFLNLSNAVDALWSLAKSNRTMEIDGQRVDRSQVKTELSSQIAQTSKPKEKAKYASAATNWDKVKMGLLGAKSALRRTESWVDAMDGGNPDGPFRKYIWNPVSEGINRYRSSKNSIIKKYLEIVKLIEKSLTWTEIDSPELGHRFNNKAELLAAILHTGNQSNLSKLLRGWGWGEVDAEGNLDTSRWDAFVARMQREGVLTKADYDFAQNVWDLLEEIKPQAQKAHKQMYGFYFNEITANPVVTPFGTYRGGYVPAVADQMASPDVAIRQEQNTVEKFNNSFMFPTTGRGFSKNRVEDYAAPLSLDLGLVPGHIDKVLRFTHIEPHVKDVSKILWDKGFRKQLDEVDPTVVGDMLVPWLQRSAQQKIQTPSQGWGGKALDTFFRELRTRTGLQVMTANVVNTIQQFTGFSISALKVDSKYLRNAFFGYIKEPGKVTADISEKSEFMKNRVSTQTMEMSQAIDDILLNPSKYDKARDFAKRHGYFLQAGTQNIVDVITWSGAYDQAVSEGATEKEAVRRADSAVRLTQGSFNAEDVSRFETGTALARAFTMFYSYFNMQANLLGTEFITGVRNQGLKKGAGRALYIYTLGFMLPAVLSDLLVRASGGHFDEDDDDSYLDDFMASFFGGQFRAATAMFPIVGPTVQSGINAFNDKWYDDRISTSPAVSMVESAVSAPHSVYKAITDDGSKKKATRDTLSALGLMTGLPLAPLARPLGYLSEVNEGTIEPSGPVDFARGLVTGRGNRQ